MSLSVWFLVASLLACESEDPSRMWLSLDHSLPPLEGIRIVVTDVLATRPFGFEELPHTSGGVRVARQATDPLSNFGWFGDRESVAIAAEHQQVPGEAPWVCWGWSSEGEIF